MSETIKIAAAQMSPKLGDVAGNRKDLINWCQTAAEIGAKLVLFPECALTGYVIDSRDQAGTLAETVPGPSTQAVSEVCERLVLYVLFGLIEQDGSQLYNTAALVGPSGFLVRYRKVHLPAMGVDRFLDAGGEPFTVVTLPDLDLKIGIQICYDGAFPEPSRVQALLGADLIVLPTNWPAGAEPLAEHVMACRAIDNVVYTAAINRVGEEAGATFIGRSGIYDPAGRALAKASATGTVILQADIEPARARNKRIVRVPGSQEFNRIADRRPDFYGPITGR